MTLTDRQFSIIIRNQNKLARGLEHMATAFNRIGLMADHDLNNALTEFATIQPPLTDERNDDHDESPECQSVPNQELQTPLVADEGHEDIQAT